MSTALKSQKTHGRAPTFTERHAVDEFLSGMGARGLLTRREAHDLAKRFDVYYSPKGGSIIARIDLAEHICRRLSL